MNAKKTVVLVLSGLMVVAAFAQVAKKAELSPEEKAARKAAVRVAMLKKTGGFVRQPGSMKGRIVLIDAQTLYDASNVTSVAASLAQQTKFDVVGVKGSGSNVKKLMGDNGAAVAVLAIQDPESPVLTVAPEEHWAIVNVSKIAEGLKTDEAKAKFAPARFRKELLKAYAYAAGGGASQYPDNVMSAKDVPGLDVCREFLPADSLNKAAVQLKSIGLRPANVTTYRQACRQGWASQPTNDIQKAIWDEVHALPTEPIKIKPETKKVKE